MDHDKLQTNIFSSENYNIKIVEFIRLNQRECPCWMFYTKDLGLSIFSQTAGYL